MLIKKSPDIRESEVTPESWYVRRREFLQVAGSTAVAVAAGAAGPLFSGTDTALAQNPAAKKLENLKKSPLSTDEKLNSYRTSPPTTTSTSSASTRAIRRNIPARSSRARGRWWSKGSAPSPAPTTWKTS